MPDVRKITIEIINGTGGGGETPTDTEESKVKQTARSVIINQAYAQAKQSVINTINASINQYVALSEDYMAENTLNHIKTAVSKFQGFGSATLGGYAVGKAISPSLGVATAILSVGGHMYSEYVNYQTRMSGYYRSLNATKYQTEFDRSRAGLTNGNKGTEN